MKKLLIFSVIAITLFICSCNNSLSINQVENRNDSIQTDTLGIYLQRMDSINNSGRLRHVDVYKLGKMKSIEFQVVRVSSETDTVEYINLRKDCGGEYYYDWEDATLLAEEVKFFVTAIDTIANNFERVVVNEERYAYITRDDIRLFSYNLNNNGKWNAELSVDYRKKNSYINIGKDDFESLKSLLINGEMKIKELRK